MAVGDGQYPYLHRRQPDGKSAAVVLDEDTDEAFDAAKNDAVEHHRPVLLAVLTDVAEIKFLRHEEIQLDGAALPGTAQGVFQVKVDLGAVEGAVTFINGIGHLQSLQGLAQGAGSCLPYLFRPHGISGPGGKLNVILKAEKAVEAVHQVDDALDLGRDLGGQHENMGVVLGEGAHPHQAVQDAGLLVAVHQAHLRQAQGQVAVAVLLGFVDQNAPGAVHRFDGVVNVINSGEVHVLLVVVPVARLLPQGAAEDNRGADLQVAGAAVLLAPELLQLVAEDHAPGVEEGEPRPFFVEAEETQLRPQAAVVAFFRLFQAVQVFLQVFGLRESGAVEPLQHGVGLAAAPVGAGQTGKLHRLEIAGGRQVGAGAEVDKIALAVGTDRHPRRQVVDEFELVGFIQLLEKLQGLGTADLPPLQGQVGLDDPLHLRLDGRQVIRGKFMLAVEVVIKPVGDGRADAQFGLREEVLDGLGHDVGRCVAVGQAAALIGKGQQLQPALLRQGAGQVPHLAVDPRRYRRAGQPWRDILRHLQSRGAGTVLFDAAVG